MACICWVTHAMAAPMPRTGSVWLDAVCLVPNWSAAGWWPGSVGTIFRSAPAEPGRTSGVWADRGGRRGMSRSGLREEGKWRP